MSRTVEENKALLEKYPILRQRNVYTGEPIDNNDEYTFLDAMPQGWAKAFGIPMFEDIQNEVNTWSKEEQERFFFTDIKEKYGELRVYTSHMTDNLFKILEAYCAISRNVCIVCGKLDVPMVNRGWISPYCRDCALHADIECLDDYDDAVKDERKEIVENLLFSTYTDGKCCPHAIDISSFVKKVREYNANRA